MDGIGNLIHYNNNLVSTKSICVVGCAGWVAQPIWEDPACMNIVILLGKLFRPAKTGPACLKMKVTCEYSKLSIK